MLSDFVHDFLIEASFQGSSVVMVNTISCVFSRYEIKKMWKPFSRSRPLENRSLKYSSYIIFQGSYAMYTSPASQIAVKLMCNKEKITDKRKSYESNASMLSGLTLGDFDRKVEQLKDLSRLLWRHAGEIFSRDTSPGYAVANFVL